MTSDGTCERREDGIHCEHWWDDEGPCCTCGNDEDLDNEPRAVLSNGTGDDT